jgi:hypothetical protein
MGYVVAVILFATSYYVWYYNDTHTNSYLYIPLLDYVPSLHGSIEAQAEWSWRIGVALGVVVLVLAILRTIRNLLRKEPADGE